MSIVSICHSLVYVTPLFKTNQHIFAGYKSGSHNGRKSIDQNRDRMLNLTKIVILTWLVPNASYPCLQWFHPTSLYEVKCHIFN